MRPGRWGVLALALAAVSLASPSEPVTLRLALHEGDEALRILRAAVRDFEALNPDIRVKIENFSDYELYNQKILVQVAANTPPDVGVMDMPRFQALAKRNAIVSLSPFMARSPGFNLAQYYKPIVEALTLDGQLYVMPRDIAPQGLVYYNRKLFDEAGIPYPDGSWTWDFVERPELREKDFLWVMRRLTRRNARGKTDRWAFASAWPQLFPTTLAYTAGLQEVDDYKRPTRVTMDTPEMLRIYEFTNNLVTKSGWMPSQTEIASVQQSNAPMLFVSGKLAMFQSGIWEVPNLRKYLKPGQEGFFEWDIAPFPAKVDGKRASPTGGSGYAIFRTTRYPQQAWRLVQFMAGPVAMERLARAGLAQPAIRSVALSDAWLPGPNTPLEQRYPPSRIVTDQLVPFVNFGCLADYWPEAEGLLKARLEGIYSGALTPREALKLGTMEAQERLDTTLRKESLPIFEWRLTWIAAALVVAGIGAALFLPERGIPYTRRQRGENRSAYLFLLPWLLGLVAFTLGPMILSLLMSLNEWDAIQPARWRGLGNYSEAFSGDPRFWQSLKVTAVYSLVSVPLGLLFSLALALLLNTKIRGIPLFRAIYYLPSLASFVAASLIWRKVFAPEGGLLNAVIYGPNSDRDLFGLGSLLSSWAGKPTEPINWLGNEKTALASLIVMSLWGVGAGMVILLAGLQGVPQQYYEAATVDGAGPWKRLRHVTLPLLTPSIFFALVTGVIGSLQVFTQAYVMTAGGPNDATLFYMLKLYRTAFESLRMGYAAALAWVLFVIIFVLTMTQFKFSKWVYYESDEAL